MTLYRSTHIQRLCGQTTIPGDKSISHRALMLSSQVLGATEIQGLLEGEDVLNTAEALRRLGVRIDRISDGYWRVQGVGVGGLHESADVLDMGNSGTSTRLLMGLMTPYPFTTFFTGDASLRSRPMGRVATPLAEIGARIVSRSENRLPLALIGTENPLPIEYRLPVASAQVKSAILLAGLNTPGVTTVIEPQATRDHTENMLAYLSFSLERSKDKDGLSRISIAGQQEIQPASRSITVPADPSSAAFLVVAALIARESEVTLPNVCVNPLRTGLFDTLKEMGGAIAFRNERVVAGERVADISVKSSKLKGVRVPASRAPSMIDEYPILSIAAACAEGDTVMEGLAELRVKESDRLSAIINGLASCGVQAVANGDTLTVTGKGTAPRGGGNIITRHDHRIAMSFLVMGMVSEEPVTIDDAASIATSFPQFIDICNRLGGRIAPVRSTTAPSFAAFPPLVLAIDGPAASGKGTLARRVAEYFGYRYLDTGSLYRAVAMKVVYAEKDPHDEEAAITAARDIDIDDIANPRLRQEHVGQAASIISAMPEVRQILLDYQRRFASSGKGAVLDGRDIGTVVYPGADFKFFVTASLEARARRRHRELSGQGIEVVYESVLNDLRERDERDAKRPIAPMKPADDAIIIDTSTMDASSVFEKVKTMVLQRLAVAA